MKTLSDKYKTAKCSLFSIVRDTSIYPILFDAVNRTHQLTIHVYQFLRLWILDKYHQNKIIPLITEDMIRMAFKCLKLDCNGPKLEETNELLYQEFIRFYDEKYKFLGYNTKIDGVNLSHILIYEVIDILTNIENNIKQNFQKYVNRFVTSSFKQKNIELIKQQEPKNKKSFKKQLNKDLYDIKQDLFNNTLKSSQKYHDWIMEQRIYIFPKCENFFINLYNNPQNYLSGTIYMCLKLEKQDRKLFQFFPLRKESVPKYITLDSSAIIDLITKNYKKWHPLTSPNGKDKRPELWSKYFYLDYKAFKQKNYIFDYMISTDCFAVSIQLLHKDYVEQEKTTKKLLSIACNVEKQKYAKMSQKEKEIYKAKKKRKKKKQKAIKEYKKKETISEFPYLEDLTDNQYEELQESNWICIDPGKRVLLYMKDDNDNRFRYTNQNHMFKTKRLKYQDKIQNYKDINEITPIEKQLLGTNSKSCQFDIFQTYISIKNKVNKEILEKYQEKIFRQYKWYSHINRKRTETDLIRDIKNKYGNDVKLIMGDWSERAGRTPLNMKYISTPGIGLKRKLAEHFTIYNLDEYRTSCLNYKTEEKCENIVLPDKTGFSRKIHSVLTYQMENKRMGCINRDENAVNNMVKIVKQFLKDKTRPEKYRRDYKFPEIKDTNPKLILASNGIKLF